MPRRADDRVVAVESLGGRRARRRGPAKSPNAVGPEPVTSASGGAGLAQRVERLADRRAQRARRRLEVVDEQLGVVERRGAGAGRLAQPRGELLQLLRAAAEPEPVGLGEDRRRC